MKYAHEVIELMGPYPGKQFRMAQIVRSIDPNAAGQVRQRIRNGVLRVLESLEEHNQIEVMPAEGRGGFATYAWKVPHALSNRSAQVPARVP